jgi:hypothetical protein
VELESAVGKIYQHSHIYTVSVGTLKGFCNFVYVDYKTILGHAKTQWLSPMPAVKRKCSESKQPSLYQIFLQNQFEIFFFFSFSLTLCV